jgi:YggT family protein
MTYVLVTAFDWIIQIFSVLILIEVIGSWVLVANVRLPDAVFRVLQVIITINGFILNPIRRIMPNMGGLDLSPIIALLLLQFLSRAVHSIARG